MRKRLLVASVFAATGLAVAVPLADWLGLGLVPSLIGCSLGGACLGYVLSIFLDIFLTTGQTSETEN